MGRYGLLTTYSNTLCNQRGEQFVCNSFGDANRLRLSIDADCDAYEKRIAELTAELARVKAESLRVVKCADDMPPLNLDTLVRHIHIDGHVVRLERWDDNAVEDENEVD